MKAVSMLTPLIVSSLLLASPAAKARQVASKGSRAESSPAARKIKLALNWKPEAEFGGFYEADRAGLYRSAGLAVEIMPGGAGTPVMQMIASGQTDFGIVAADEIILARSRGADVVGLFAVYQDSPHAILTHEARAFTSLEQVFRSPGTLAIELGASMTLYMKKKYAPVKAKLVPYTGGVTHFLRDKSFSQQGFVTSESLIAARQGAKVRSFLVKDSGYNPYLVIVAAKGELVRKDPGLVKSFLAATQKGWKSYNSDPAPANVVMRKINPSIEEAIYAESAKVQIPLIENDFTKTAGLGAMSLERWTSLVSQLREIGTLKIAQELKVEDCFSNAYLPAP